jgi:hypothetical protein
MRWSRTQYECWRASDGPTSSLRGREQAWSWHSGLAFPLCCPSMSLVDDHRDDQTAEVDIQEAKRKADSEPDGGMVAT